MGQLLRIGRNMRVVAGYTAVFKLQSTMLHLYRCNLFMLVFMTCIADPLGAFTDQGVFVVAAMGVMTLHTTCFHRRMDMGFGAEGGLFVLVAAVTGVVPFSSAQQFGEFAGMVVMAGVTLTKRHRAMLNLPFDNGLAVAAQAELLPTAKQLVIIPGLMRAVAAGTFPLFNRFMHNRVKLQFVMAGVTERRNIVDFFETMGIRLFLYMAKGAVFGGHRAMDILVFTHLGVAFIC